MGLQSPDPQFESGCHLNSFFMTLVLVSTPIGNLSDLSKRGLETLKSADLILCEDTRRSSVLLNAYGVKNSLKSFHAFNERKSEDALIDKLKSGQTIALISDAGTPAICDPGQKLVKRCHEENITVSAIPGPSALIAALSLSGFESPPFQFGGFLPKKAGELKTTLLNALCFPGPSIFYDTPHHIQDTLDLLKELAPTRQLCLVRELTKQFEEVVVGNASELNLVLKGEFCLVIDRGEMPSGDPKALVTYLQNTFNLSQKESIKLAAEISKTSKRDLYQQWHQN